MGRRSKIERRANRKKRRAAKKEKRAKKAQSNGNTKRATRLNNRASRLKTKAAELKTKIDGQVVRGLTAKVVAQNSLGNTNIKASWNYFSDELSQYDKLKVSIAPFSPIRSAGWNDVEEVSSGSTSVTFKLRKNLRYVVKLFGVQSGHEKLLDRTFVKKK